MSKKEKEEKSTDQRCYPVETKNKEGSVCVITERCKGCEFCMDFCPVGALQRSEKTTEKGYHPPEMTEGCVLCGKCEKICPEFAVHIREKGVEDESDEDEEDEKEERGEWI